ncbi:MAG TPA: signal recognition particle-docking protein FtsY [Tissierellaceae bacterium]|mgnify:CR=1 FL=1
MFNWFKKLNKKKEELTDDKDIIKKEEVTEENIEEELEKQVEVINDEKDIVDMDNSEIRENIEDIDEIDVEDLEDTFEEELEINNSEIEKDEYGEVSIEEKTPKKQSFFDKLMSGLAKTRDNISSKIDNILKSYKKVDEALFDELEEVLVTADVGVKTTMTLIENLRERVKQEKVSEPNEVKKLLKDEIKKLMTETEMNYKLNIEPSPSIILVVGVNGVGKTTTIGKLAYNLRRQGKKVLIAAGDTFRAAAIEQLEEWGHRAGVDVIAHSEGADPAAVIYDGIQAAKARKIDVLICDTAGRLHNKTNLMNELNKIFRVTEKEFSNATKEVLLVLDATTGQNAMIQAKEFNDVANITGIALTKLDGTAKGGVVIALQSELKIPVKLVGVGEGIEDLQPFIVEDFVEAIID